MTSRRAAAAVAGVVALGALLVVLLAAGEGKSLAPARAAVQPPPGERRVRLPDRRRLSAADGRHGRLPRLVLRRRRRPIPPIRSVTSTPSRPRRTRPGSTAPTSATTGRRSLVLSELGDDPHWGGEYLVDIRNARKRGRAADWVDQMIEGCASKGFEAVEYDNLDSWTRFDGTPLADDVPFGKPEALAYARLLTERAHAPRPRGRPEEHRRHHPRAVRPRRVRLRDRRGVLSLRRVQPLPQRLRQPGDRDRVPARGLRKACRTVGDKISVVLRDRLVTKPGSPRYVYDAC